MHGALPPTADPARLLTMAAPDPRRYRDGMSLVSGTVHVVTTGGPAGRSGFTASAVVSVSDDPATLLVCLNRVSTVGPAIAENRVIVVNTLAARHRPIADMFAGQGGISGEGRFAVGRWSTLVTGAPVLDDALVSFDCRVVDLQNVATHTVIFAQVVGLATALPEPPLLYFGRDYHSLAPVSP
jgi:flavin reductase (DIM6/NTAB) family NADH-FMN oxidoreductase RutF